MSPPCSHPLKLVPQILVAFVLLGTTCGHPVFSPPKPGPTFCESRSSCRAPAASAAGLILQLQDAYRCRDYPCFSNLFSTAADSAAFRFFPNEPPGSSWDLTEFLRIHRRMFRPEDPLIDPPVPADLWIVSIDILLEQQTDWAERLDLYRSEANPGGVDPQRWVVTEALYFAYVFFKMSGQTDYQVNGRCNFIVLEDLRKQPGQERKFLIYRWEDLGSIATAAVTAGPNASWSQVMGLFK